MPGAIPSPYSPCPRPIPIPIYIFYLKFRVRVRLQVRRFNPPEHRSIETVQMFPVPSHQIPLRHANPAIPQILTCAPSHLALACLANPSPPPRLTLPHIAHHPAPKPKPSPRGKKKIPPRGYVCVCDRSQAKPTTNSQKEKGKKKRLMDPTRSESGEEEGEKNFSRPWGAGWRRRRIWRGRWRERGVGGTGTKVRRGVGRRGGEEVLSGSSGVEWSGAAARSGQRCSIKLRGRNRVSMVPWSSPRPNVVLVRTPDPSPLQKPPSLMSPFISIHPTTLPLPTPLVPPPLPDSRLEVRCDRRDLRAGCTGGGRKHGAAHFVAVCVDCEASKTRSAQLKE